MLWCKLLQSIQCGPGLQEMQGLSFFYIMNIWSVSSGQVCARFHEMGFYIQRPGLAEPFVEFLLEKYAGSIHFIHF
jgi:hypothetical protein